MPLYGGFAVKALLDPVTQPFLSDHQIDSTPVLPGVMGIEAFAEVASSLMKDWNVMSVEDVNFLAPFKFYRNEPRSVTTEAVFEREGETVVARCRLLGKRMLANQTEVQVTTHFTGRVRLVKDPVALGQGPKITLPDVFIGAETIYGVYFHGAAYRVMSRAWRDGQRIIGELSMSLPPNHFPVEQPLVMAPRLIEFCFQTAGLWDLAAEGKMGLPMHVERVSVCVPPHAKGGHLWGNLDVPLYAVVTAHAGTFDAEVVDASGKRYVMLTGYQTVALPEKVDPAPFRVLQPEEECEVIPV